MPPKIVPFEEFDWRLTSTAAVFKTITAAIAETEGRFAELNEQYDTDLGLDLIENLLGLAFVAAQAYIVGTISDARRIAKAATGFSKHELLKIGTSTMLRSTTTQIELVDAVANYYKHHAEWSDRSRQGPHQRTVDRLRSLGADETEPFLCIMAAESLHNECQGPELNTLLSIITEWRKAVINHAQSRRT